MRISEGICEYNTGYLKTVSEIQKACGLTTSPGTNTAKIAKSFDTIRLRLAKKRKESKFQDYQRKKKIATLQDEERRKEREGVTYAAGDF